MSPPTFAVVLPARYASTRFPGKPLAPIGGKPLIEWVYRRAQEIRGASELVVATDDERIARAVEGFGGRAVMTSHDHATGTDRVAEVAAGLDVDVVVNLQGDEPVFDPAMVEEMVAALGRDGELDIVTAAHPIDDEALWHDPNAVKVVVGADGRALYFSRAPIPHGTFAAARLRHVGVYAFRRTSLLRFAALEPTKLERSERLEQLRALENGMTIGVVTVARATFGVDVPDDIKSVEKAMGTTYTT